MGDMNVLLQFRLTNIYVNDKGDYSAAQCRIISFAVMMTAPVSVLHRRHGNFRYHYLSLFPSQSPILSSPFPYVFFILFGNTTKTAPVSAPHQHHGDFSVMLYNSPLK